MEAVKNGILMAAGAIGFCLAIVIFLFITSTVDEAAERVFDRSSPATQIGYATAIDQEPDVYEGKMSVWTGKELISYLMCDHHDIDIMINSEPLKAEDINRFSVQNIAVSKTSEYRLQYLYGKDGKLCCLIFSVVG